MGTLMWFASSREDAVHMKSTYAAKGATNFILERVDGYPTWAVIFDVEKENAEAVLGYEPDEEEWLTPEGSEE